MITAETFLGWKEARVGATIVSLVAETVPEMRKTDNPYWGRVKKVARVGGILNWIYENSVNAQRLREGLPADFSAMPRAWGERIQGTPLVEYRGKYYLEVKVQNSLAEYYLDGQPVNKETLEPFLRENKSSRQGVEKEIICRDYLLGNVVTITWKGETFRVAA